MPIVATNNHPSLKRIEDEGQEVIPFERAKHQDIRELHIGFLNMMPDGAFLATERQFFRLLGASNKIAQLYVHPIKLEGINRSKEISQHIDTYYEKFSDIAQEGLDALIITGANPSKENIIDEDYWQHAEKIFAWAEDNVTSVFFSCLATHAMLQAHYHIFRQPLDEKLWGVFSHQVKTTSHPLVSNINTRFDMPHSRGNNIKKEAFEKVGLQILVSSQKAGVALATSPDGIRQVFCQGHPEYDTLSLLKEYHREVKNFFANKRSKYPPTPKNYLSDEAIEVIQTWKESVAHNKDLVNSFPLDQLADLIDNTWRDTAKSIFSNWLGLIYQITHVDRTKLFMDGIDKNNPLNLK